MYKEGKIQRQQRVFGPPSRGGFGAPSLALGCGPVGRAGWELIVTGGSNPLSARWSVLRQGAEPQHGSCPSLVNVRVIKGHFKALLGPCE